MDFGLYLAVPFCRSKCSFCNFASQVFPRAALEEYCTLLAREIELAAAADGLQGRELTSIYWGGGTPTLLPRAGIERIIAAIRANFVLSPRLEHTVEAAPGTLTDPVIAAWLAAGANRFSLGVQAFADAEVRAVGRLHTCAIALADLERLRRAGIVNLGVDLIAGLPHQTVATWRESLQQALAASHVSVYMLEVDAESRLGGELLAGGSRYHAHAVPDDDQIADAYELACELLPAAGLPQYEISNFARPGFASRHNSLTWARLPYLGCGLDAHSFLPPRRFANPDLLESYLAPLREERLPRAPAAVLTTQAAIEETLFLGLRRNGGLSAPELDSAFAQLPSFRSWLAPRLNDLEQRGLLVFDASGLRLTPRGRLLSNQVFSAFLGAQLVAHC